MSSKPTSEEQFLNSGQIDGAERIRISKRDSTGQRLWKNFQIDFTGFVRWFSTAFQTAKSVTGNGTSVNPIQLVNDEETPSANQHYGTDSFGVKGWQDSSTATDKSVTGDGSSGSPIELVNDQETPSERQYYGTDNTAVKGWFDLASIIDIDVSSNPDYPAGFKGDILRATNGTGRIGGASGAQADTGDFIVCLNDNAGGDQATVGTDWQIISAFDPIAKGYGESALQQTILTGTANQALSPRSAAYGEGGKSVNSNAIAAGDGSLAAGKNSHSKGLDCKAVGNYSTAEGENCRTGSTPQLFTRAVNTVTIVGDVTAEYDQTAEIVLYDLTGGVLNTVFVINGLTITTNPAFGGVNTTFNVTGLNAAMGDRTGGMIAPVGIRGVAAHAEGKDTIAFNWQSHAEGVSTEALGVASHVEGNGTSTGTSGTYAHAEGSNTQANSLAAHAEGENTEAAFSDSHAGGRDSKTGVLYQFARSSGRFSEFGDSQVSILYPTALTTGNQTLQLRTNNNNGTGGTLAIEPVGTTQAWSFYLNLVGIQISGAAGSVGDTYAVQIAGCIKTVSSALSIVGTPVTVFEDSDAGVAFVFDHANLAASALFQVIGEADKNVRWSGGLHLTELAAEMS